MRKDFRGKSYRSIDTKGRIMISSQFREIIERHYGPDLVITNDVSDKCLCIYPMEEFNALVEKVRSLPKSSKRMKRYRRVVIGSAEDVTLDKHGRILIPAALRQDADLLNDVVMVGQVEKIELWSKENWERDVVSEDSDDEYDEL